MFGVAVCVLKLSHVISVSKKLRIIGLSDNGILSSSVNAVPVPFSVRGAAGTSTALGRFTLVCCNQEHTNLTKHRGDPATCDFFWQRHDE